MPNNQKFSPVGALVFPVKLEETQTIPLAIDDPVKLLETFFDHPVTFRGKDAR